MISQPKQLDLSIVIINWNSAAFLQKCLKSMYANPQHLRFEVVVVDNASLDGCDKIVQQEFPQVKFVQNIDNAGFGRGNNLGFEHSSGRNILFLNPDTEVLGQALPTLVSFLESTPDAGIVGARLLNSDLTVQSSCIQTFPTVVNQALDCELLRHLFPRSSLWGITALFDSTKPVSVDVVSGACLMIRRHVFEHVGRFSSSYFMYTEDVDLCYKVKKAGWRTYYVSSALVIHHGGQSSASQSASNFAAVMMRESKMRFLKTWRGRFYADLYQASMVFVAIGRLSLLALVLLVTFGQFHGQSLRRSFTKWTKIFRWGLGLESWVRETT